MFHRLHTRSKWDSLFFCGESTVMGTGTPTVTTSGLSAANAILKKRGLAPFVYEKDQTNYVRQLPVPFSADQLYADEPEPRKSIMKAAMHCRFCEYPSCCGNDGADVPGILRRVAVGNYYGAKKCFAAHPADAKTLKEYEACCIRLQEGGDGVEISRIISALMEE